MPASAQKRALSQIAEEISEDWTPPNYAAEPYLNAMHRLTLITDNYYEDDGKSVVLYFLNNAASWRGDTAKRIKAELRAMVK